MAELSAKQFSDDKELTGTRLTQSLAESEFKTCLPPVPDTQW